MADTPPKLALSLDHPSLGSVSSDEMVRYVTAVRYVESTDALDAATLTLSCPDLSSPSSKVKPLLVPGSVLTITLQDDGHDVRSVSLDVVTARHTQRVDRPAFITLQALEPLQRVRGMRVSQVADAGGELLQLLSDAAKTATGGSADRASVQDEAAFGVSFLDRPLLGSLKRAAWQRGLVASLTISSTGMAKLGFVKQDDGAAVSLTWGKDLRAMDLTMDLSQQVTAVEVYGLPDPTDQSMAEKDPTPGKAPKGASSSGKLTGAGLLKGWKVNRVAAVQAWLPSDVDAMEGDSEMANPCKPGDLDKEAARLYAEIARRFVSGRITCRAQPKACKNGSLTLKNAPWPYDGTLSIVEVQHAWSSDEAFTTEIGFEADALSKP